MQKLINNTRMQLNEAIAILLENGWTAQTLLEDSKTYTKSDKRIELLVTLSKIYIKLTVDDEDIDIINFEDIDSKLVTFFITK